MADPNLDLKIKITADNQASPDLSAVQAEIAQLRTELEELKAQNDKLNDSSPSFFSRLLDGAWKLITGIAAIKLIMNDFGKMSDEEFLKYAEGQIKAAQATGQAVDASIQQEAANRKLSVSYTELVDKITKGNEHFDELIKEINDTRKAHEQLIQTQKLGNESIDAYNKAQEAQSSVFGGTKDALQALISTQQRSLVAAQNEADSKRKIADEELNNLETLKKEQSIINDQTDEFQKQSLIRESLSKIGLGWLLEETNVTKTLSAEQKTQLETMRQSAIQKNDEAKIAEYHVLQLKAEAQGTQSVTEQINKLINASSIESDLQLKSLDSEKSLIEARKNEAIERLKVTKSKEDEAAVEELSNQLAQEEIKIADQLADKDRAKADAARAYANSVKDRVNATDSATAADQHEIIVSDQIATALGKAALASFNNAQAKRNAAESSEAISKAELIAAEKSVAATEAQQRALEKQNTLALKENDIKLQLAIGEGRYADAIKLSIEQEALRTQGNQNRVEQIKKEIESQQNLIHSLENYGQVIDGKIVPADEAIVAAAKEKLLSMQAELKQNELLLNKIDELSIAKQKEIELTKNVAVTVLALAKARGDDQEAAKQGVIISQQEVAESQRVLATKNAELQAAKDTLALKIEENQGRILTIEDYDREIQASKNAVTQKQLEAQQAQTNLELQQKIQNQAEIMAGPIGQLQRLYENNTAALALETAQTGRYYDAQINSAQADERSAQAKGDMLAVSDATVKIKELEAEKAQALADALNNESKNQINLLEAKKLSVLVSDESIISKNKEIDQLNLLIEKEKGSSQQSQDNADAKKAEAEATVKNNEALKDTHQSMEDAASAAAFLAKNTNSVREEMKGLSAQAAIFFDLELGKALGQFGIAGGFEEARKASVAFTGAIGNANVANFRSQIESAALSIKSARNEMLFAANDIGVYEAALKLASAQTSLAFYQQKLAVEGLKESLATSIKNGTANMASLENATLQVNSGFNLLGKQDLAELRAAIDDAKIKMESLRKASEDTLAAAQQTLLQEQGDTTGVLRLQQKKDELELQNKINEAKALGDRESINNLETALALEQQTYQLKLKKAEADATAAKTTAATGSSSVASAGAAALASPGRTFTLNLTGGGQTLQASTITDPTAFLNSLKNAQRSAA